jgi:arsenate reductase
MKVAVGFICIGNSCRSQMAEGFANKHGKEFFEIYSAGTHPAYMVSPDAVEAMKEKGIDISMQYPKSLNEIPGELDILITMGCGVECPYLPAGFREDWGIEDPVGLPLNEFRRIRDIIEKKVMELVEIAGNSATKKVFLEKLIARSSKD